MPERVVIVARLAPACGLEVRSRTEPFVVVYSTIPGAGCKAMP
jgi:hypothetical protein